MNGPYQDIYRADGTLNYEYCRWLIQHAEQRGWLKRSRWLTQNEINAAIKGKEHRAR